MNGIMQALATYREHNHIFFEHIIDTPHELQGVLLRVQSKLWKVRSWAQKN